MTEKTKTNSEDIHVQYTSTFMYHIHVQGFKGTWDNTIQSSFMYMYVLIIQRNNTNCSTFEVAIYMYLYN